MKFQDLTGRKFGKLTVVKRAENNKYNQVMWVCLCDCGNITKPIVANHLKSGNTTSCGCVHSEEARRRMTRHGQKNTRIYRIWQGMLRRCDNQKHKDFKYYGGRGITVCEEWRNSFEAFCGWSMANGYADELTIDRKDNDKGYSPDNCRWTSMKEQGENKRPGVNPYRNKKTGRYTSKSEFEAGFDLKGRDEK